MSTTEGNGNQEGKGGMLRCLCNIVGLSFGHCERNNMQESRKGIHPIPTCVVESFEWHPILQCHGD